jgi:hypothetical protein
MPDTVPLAGLTPGAVFRRPDGRYCHLLWNNTKQGTVMACSLGPPNTHERLENDILVTPIDIAALERDRDDALAVMHDYCTDGEGAYSAGFLHGWNECREAAIAAADTFAVDTECATASYRIRALCPAAAHAPPYRRLLERCRHELRLHNVESGYVTPREILDDIDAALAEKE